MRLTLGVLGVSIALTVAGLAFAVAVCLFTAGLVWLIHAFVRALPPPGADPGVRAERRR